MAAQVQAVLQERCTGCHGAQVQMKNIRLDSADALKLNAQNVYQQAVVTRQMPLNNATQITEDERQLIARWFKEGAKVDGLTQDPQAQKNRWDHRRLLF